MTAGYPEMAKAINDISKELQIELLVVEGILQEAAREVKLAVDTGEYEVVISRAGTAKEINKLIDLPLVYSDSDHFDLLKGFIKAKEMGNKICFITYPETGFMFSFKEIKKIIGFDVTILEYKTQEELINQIKYAKEIGIEVVVGGGIRAADVAESYGMNSVNLSISNRSIKRTLLLAKKVARDRTLIKKEGERINAVFNASQDGIIFLNEDEIIESHNKAVERIFNIKENNLKNKNIKQLSNKKLRNLLDPNVIYQESGNFTKTNINVTYEPVILNYVRIGIIVTFKEISEIQKLETKIRRDLYSKGLLAKYTFNDITHHSKKMNNIIYLAKEYAATTSTILITGESGTGKELMAQSIHNYSMRKQGAFVAVNCAALPENLLESELFGYAEGAFTGANIGGRQGLFELSHDGTIFLDEIGEIPSHIQTRLLRVLQEKEVMRVGGDRVVPVNIRVIAATNQKLWNLVEEGKFRLDLYFRLSVLHLEIPPLFHRNKDIPILIDYFLERLNVEKRYKDFTEDLQSFFMSYKWPGNIRQLENVIERYSLIMHHENIEDEFIKNILMETRTSIPNTRNEHDSFIVESGTISEIEKQIILKMLQKYNNKKTLVAEKLGISRTTLWKKLNAE